MNSSRHSRSDWKYVRPGGWRRSTWAIEVGALAPASARVVVRGRRRMGLGGGAIYREIPVVADDASGASRVGMAPPCRHTAWGLPVRQAHAAHTVGVALRPAFAYYECHDDRTRERVSPGLPRHLQPL